jgi:chromosomal replication initiation ATPase DnaA
LFFMMWEGGGFTNAETGEIFGVSHTAVSHTVNKVKGQLETDRHFREKYRLNNSQIKM